MRYIATFFSHFGATRFKKELNNHNIECKLMPVPRALSSSCGTCALYENDKIYPDDNLPDYLEKIYEVIAEEKYELKYEIKD